MHEILLEAGCPADACVFLPGRGETVAPVVRDPRTAIIAFTEQGGRPRHPEGGRHHPRGPAPH